jgi:hypothetical protein
MTSLANGRVVSEAGIRMVLLRMLIPGSRQRVEQRLCLFQVGGVEALGKPAVDRREEVAGFGMPTLLAPMPGRQPSAFSGRVVSRQYGIARQIPLRTPVGVADQVYSDDTAQGLSALAHARGIGARARYQTD